MFAGQEINKIYTFEYEPSILLNMNQSEQQPIPGGPKENFNEIEAGRLKERLIEAIKTLPGTIKDMAPKYKN